MILIFRKFKAHLLAGFLFTIGLSVGYAWLVSSLFKLDWFGVLGAVVILISTSYSGHPMTSKKELGLYKILGAHKNNILPFILTQATLLAGIATLVALAIMGIASNSLVINIHTLQATGHEWILPVSTTALIIIMVFMFLRLFALSRTSISKK